MHARQRLHTIVEQRDLQSYQVEDDVLIGVLLFGEQQSFVCQHWTADDKSAGCRGGRGKEEEINQRERQKESYGVIERARQKARHREG